MIIKLIPDRKNGAHRILTQAAQRARPLVIGYAARTRHRGERIILADEHGPLFCTITSADGSHSLQEGDLATIKVTVSFAPATGEITLVGDIDQMEM